MVTPTSITVEDIIVNLEFASRQVDIEKAKKVPMETYRIEQKTVSLQCLTRLDDTYKGNTGTFKREVI